MPEAIISAKGTEAPTVRSGRFTALLDDGLDTLQELLEAIPQDSRQLSCEELVPRLRKALGQAKTCGKLEQQIRDLEES